MRMNLKYRTVSMEELKKRLHYDVLKYQDIIKRLRGDKKDEVCAELETLVTKLQSVLDGLS